MLWGSRKVGDLLRDPRVLVHSIVTSRDSRDGEFKLRGFARAEHDHAVQHRLRQRGRCGTGLGT
jgi:hypothetical protein